ncbi:MAG: DUF1616 domain-containing protein [Anaerolineae bacterium]|nr:DUF1616 domain-containing protein [Anaerolineae bacterium]
MHRPVRPGLELFCLLAVVVVSAVLVLEVRWPALRVASGLLMLFLLPGYLLARFLWPAGGWLPGIWSLGLILPCSFVLVGGLLLLLSYVWGYQPHRAIVLVAMLNGVLATSGYLRRRGSPARPSSCWPTLRQRLTGWHALVALAAVVLLGSTLYAIVTPRQTPGYTEFYVLAEDGHLPVGYGGTGGLAAAIQYGIRNQEGRQMEYKLLVVAETPERRLLLGSHDVTVAAGAAVQAPVDLSALPARSTGILLLLFRAGLAQPYRSLHLRVY